MTVRDFINTLLINTRNPDSIAIMLKNDCDGEKEIPCLLSMAVEKFTLDSKEFNGITFQKSVAVEIVGSYKHHIEYDYLPCIIIHFV